MPSIVYKIDDATLCDAVKSSISIRQVLIKVGLNATGSAYRILKKRIKKLKLDTSHLLGKSYMRGQHHSWAPKKPLDEILIEESSYMNNSRLKIRLLSSDLLFNKCYECNLPPIWNNLPIVLQLDHINGKHQDNRIENLRLLCPNCHSQTSTFAGKNQSGGHGGT